MLVSMQTPHLSEDGQFLWDGTQWITAQYSPDKAHVWDGTAWLPVPAPESPAVVEPAPVASSTPAQALNPLPVEREQFTPAPTSAGPVSDFRDLDTTETPVSSSTADSDDGKADGKDPEAGGKGLLIGVGAVLAVCAIGAGSWFFLGDDESATPPAGLGGMGMMQMPSQAQMDLREDVKAIATAITEGAEKAGELPGFTEPSATYPDPIKGAVPGDGNKSLAALGVTLNGVTIYDYVASSPEDTSTFTLCVADPSSGEWVAYSTLSKTYVGAGREGEPCGAGSNPMAAAMLNADGSQVPALPGVSQAP